MSIEISARTKDPQLSANIVNAIIGLIDPIRNRILKQNIIVAHNSISKEYRMQKNNLDSLVNLIKTMRDEYGNPAISLLANQEFNFDNKKMGNNTLLEEKIDKYLSQKVIDLMDRRVDVNQVREMIQLSQLHGIQAGTFIMVGYPGETEDDIFETVNHLKVSNPDIFTITVAYPIKGTPLYQEVEDRFIANLPWETSTDRDIDFKRTYSRKYYNYAVSMIVNEVNAYKAQQKGEVLKMSKAKLKAVIQRGRMYLAR